MQKQVQVQVQDDTAYKVKNTFLEFSVPGEVASSSALKRRTRSDMCNQDARRSPLVVAAKSPAHSPLLCPSEAVMQAVPIDEVTFELLDEAAVDMGAASCSGGAVGEMVAHSNAGLGRGEPAYVVPTTPSPFLHSAFPPTAVPPFGGNYGYGLPDMGLPPAFGTDTEGMQMMADSGCFAMQDADGQFMHGVPFLPDMYDASYGCGWGGWMPMQEGADGSFMQGGDGSREQGGDGNDMDAYGECGAAASGSGEGGRGGRQHGEGGEAKPAKEGRRKKRDEERAERRAAREAAAVQAASDGARGGGGASPGDEATAEWEENADAAAKEESPADGGSAGADAKSSEKRRDPGGGGGFDPQEEKRREAAAGGGSEAFEVPANYTTVMLRNIPNKYTREMLIKQLNVEFSGMYDFMYLPIDFKNKCNVGYGFINFRTPEACLDFVSKFHGVDVRKCLPGLNSRKVVEVTPARVQGRSENVRRLKNSPVMNQLQDHPEWMPLLFAKTGEEEPFPAPDAPLPPVKPRGRNREPRNADG